MSRTNAERLSFFLLLIALTFSFVSVVRSEDSFTEAERGISAARDQINESFKSVRAAEDAGANTDDLIERLNTALNLTLEAQSRLSNGNSSEAMVLASNAIRIAEEVAVQSAIKKQQALSVSILQKYETIIVFAVADVAICLSGIFLIHKWQWQSTVKKKPKLVK